MVMNRAVGLLGSTVEVWDYQHLPIRRRREMLNGEAVQDKCAGTICCSRLHSAGLLLYDVGKIKTLPRFHNQRIVCYIKTWTNTLDLLNMYEFGHLDELYIQKAEHFYVLDKTNKQSSE